MTDNQVQAIKEQIKSVKTELKKLEEIFERNLQLENSKFPPKCLVQVTDITESYPIYRFWRGLKGYEQNYVEGREPEEGKNYMVLHTEPHGNKRCGDLALIQDPDTNQVFIINVRGIERSDENE